MASVMSAFELNSDSTHAAANPKAAKKIPIYGKKTAAPVLSKGCRDLTRPGHEPPHTIYYWAAPPGPSKACLLR
jgi:hypothetical protein